MKITTLCYLEKGEYILMLHRIKKKEDENAGKWIGVGGKLEENESPVECIKREIEEETGLIVEKVKERGILFFVLPKWGNELIFLYTADEFKGELKECDEGELRWIKKDEVLNLSLWEGDRAFLPLLLNSEERVNMKLIYNQDDQLVSVKNENI